MPRKLAAAAPRPGTPLLGAPDKLPVSNLLLDDQNPRLALDGGQRTQKELTKRLWEDMAVDEVALSIASNGFFQEEPLFVIPREKTGDWLKRKYVVVEGNRRLAAVLLLRDAGLRVYAGATSLPILGAADLAKLDQLPVSVYGAREDLWQYFGFRHINGPKPWDAYSKAHYVAEVFEKYGVPLEQIAQSIGDRHATVTRLYRGLKLLEQAEASGFDADDRVSHRFYFSHLYTAADQREFQTFLGIDADSSLKKNPVPRSKIRALKELMVWLFGSKADKKASLIQSQNPDLNTLREVISRPAGLDALRIGLSLERARQAAVGDKRRFREALGRAREDLREAKSTVTNGYSGEPDLLDVIQQIVLEADSIQEDMDRKRKKIGQARVQ